MRSGQLEGKWSRRGAIAGWVGVAVALVFGVVGLSYGTTSGAEVPPTTSPAPPPPGPEPGDDLGGGSSNGRGDSNRSTGAGAGRSTETAILTSVEVGLGQSNAGEDTYEAYRWVPEIGVDYWWTARDQNGDTIATND